MSILEVYREGIPSSVLRAVRERYASASRRVRAWHDLHFRRTYGCGQYWIPPTGEWTLSPWGMIRKQDAPRSSVIRQGYLDQYRAWIHMRVLAWGSDQVEWALGDLYFYRQRIIMAVAGHEESVMLSACGLTLAGAESFSARNLADETGIEIATMSALIHRLETRGLLVSVADVAGRKQWTVDDKLLLAAFVPILLRRHRRRISLEPLALMLSLIEEARSRV